MSTSPAADETSDPTGHDAPARRPRRRRGRIVGLVLLLLVVVGVVLVVLAIPLLRAKQEADAATADLKAAKTALSAHQLDRAKVLVASARTHVDTAHADAHGFGSTVWSAVPVAGGAVDDARHLVDALSEATSVAQLGVQLYPMVSGGSSHLVQGQTINMAVLQQVVQRTTAIGQHLDAAAADLGEVSGTTPVVGHSVANAKASALGYLQPLQDSYRRAGPLVESLPAIVGGSGRRTYLLAMLNPAEQRFSGGGALSFTSMTFDHGRVRFGSTVDVNDIIRQGITQTWPPVVGNIFHKPGPMRVVNSTFSPWWQVSSEELLRGYEKAFPGVHYDGLVGVDLQALASIFRITGPVHLPTFGTITADNLVPTLAGSYDKFASTAERKKLNSELVPAFRAKFFNGGQMQQKVKALVDAAAARNFFTYFRDRPTQRRFAAVGLSGNLTYTRNDYLGVFSQNTNGSKNDYYQHRSIVDRVRLKADGSALVSLHVTVQNQAPPYTLPTPDPKVGYTTRWLDWVLGIFFPTVCNH